MCASREMLTAMLRVEKEPHKVRVIAVLDLAGFEQLDGSAYLGQILCNIGVLQLKMELEMSRGLVAVADVNRSRRLKRENSFDVWARFMSEFYFAASEAGRLIEKFGGLHSISGDSVVFFFLGASDDKVFDVMMDSMGAFDGVIENHSSGIYGGICCPIYRVIAYPISFAHRGRLDAIGPNVDALFEKTPSDRLRKDVKIITPESCVCAISIS